MAPGEITAKDIIYRDPYTRRRYSKDGVAGRGVLVCVCVFCVSGRVCVFTCVRAFVEERSQGRLQQNILWREIHAPIGDIIL